MAYISDFTWNSDNTVCVDKIAYKPKKITGSRFAAVLGLNPFDSPFAAWCELTRVAPKPFERTAAMIAGEVIEPKLLEFARSRSKYSIVSPEDIWGWDYKNATNYDFFAEDPIFGGMWDARLQDKGAVLGIVEAKTSSNPVMWQDEVPEIYALQAQLYAYLSGCRYYHFIVGFPEPEHIEDPKSFVCSDDNTIIAHGRVEDDFAEKVRLARNWYEIHVKDGGVSPKYIEGRDAQYLSLLSERKPRP